MELREFSEKQRRVLDWWHPAGEHSRRQAIICNGAVRSGKTLCMSLSFLLWALLAFYDQDFGICGKTLISVGRNLVGPLIRAAPPGLILRQKPSRNMLEAEYGGNRARFHLFSGRDEGSAAMIQGVTLAGALFDEVALMPRGFVEQAMARCSVEGSRFWFNCNPEHPSHWFYTEWIKKREAKNALYLHFTMEDNPSLSRAVKARYRSLYSGPFYDRYVLGLWTGTYGAVYPMFKQEEHVVSVVPACTRRIISCDHGTVNPASFGLWGQGKDGVWYRLREYYHDSRREGVQKTDEEYCDALEELAGEPEAEAVLVDPSAAGFIESLRRRGKYSVLRARNDVLPGIRAVAEALARGKIKIHESCRDSIREFGLYRWSDNTAKDAPVKENDHAMDDIRYFAAYIFGGGEDAGFAAVTAERQITIDR